jgi:c-di-GMP-binding flagellar brake protein YcgR
VALKLSLPIRIDHRQQRQSCRISLAALAPIQARLTSMLDADRELDCRLLNLSGGGIAAQARWNAIESFAIGEIFWIEFDLPNVSERFEFAVRLAHRRRTEDRERGIVGWAFCGGDDQMDNYDKLERISRAIASMQPDQPSANRLRAGNG